LDANESSGLFSRPTYINAYLSKCLLFLGTKTDRHIICFQNEMRVFWVIINAFKNAELASTQDDKY